MTLRNPTAHALDVRAVSFRTPARTALVTDISFSVSQGETLAIIGPNGAGKTTLIRMIAGLAQADAGEILIGGLPLHKMSFSERARQIAYVGQSDEPDGRLTVSHYVSLGFLPHSRLFANASATEQSQDAICVVGLEALAERRMDKLSGGERQKAKIARAICQKPALLILDEPTNHLDPHARGELLSLVAGMGISVVAALHDLTLIDAFAHKVAVIKGGKLLAFGDPQTTLSSELIQDVFQVGMYRLPHPSKDHSIPTLDIGISRETPTSNVSSIV